MNFYIHFHPELQCIWKNNSTNKLIKWGESPEKKNQQNKPLCCVIYSKETCDFSVINSIWDGQMYTDIDILCIFTSNMKGKKTLIPNIYWPVSIGQAEPSHFQCNTSQLSKCCYLNSPSVIGDEEITLASLPIKHNCSGGSTVQTLHNGTTTPIILATYLHHLLTWKHGMSGKFASKSNCGMTLSIETFIL